ncbi:hypothetical protein R5R35_006364 [Gryllus longicercus]|uniref:Uncharacterized protein n=1 Tax=Gryllus longicercus TaxID=2509291 RepID=A0AAN9W4V0_9ORTH
MDIQAMQSMDWLFKKERIYLLAQFWQQRATLAEKEVSALKEQLASANQSLHLPVGEAGAKGKPGGGEDGGGGGVEHVVGRAAGLEMELAAKEKEVSVHCQKWQVEL